MCASVLFVYERRSGNTTTFHTVRLPKNSLTVSSQTDRQTQFDTDRHATATPLCGPTRYDLHLKRRYREEEEDEGKEGERFTVQSGNEEDRRSSRLLFALNCLVSPLC